MKRRRGSGSDANEAVSLGSEQKSLLKKSTNGNTMGDGGFFK
jgi:hypothetical protein